jgi:hypothetical protein
MVDFSRARLNGETLMDLLNRERAGRSAERKRKEMTRAWQARTFGRRARFYAIALYALLIIVIVNLDLSGRWALFAGVTFGMAVASTWLIPDALQPTHITNWQLGAWGEQMTASELKALRREGWIVRHDVKWGDRANHDHVVAGAAVYVLNSKNLKDSEMSIEDRGIRVTRIENPQDGYLADRWCSKVQKEAWSLKQKLDRDLGFPVHVYPVLVLWGRFAVGQAYSGNVSVVAGDTLVEWIKSRPTDFRDPEKRRKVGLAVNRLPAA